MFVCVLCVLMISLMTKGVPPPATVTEGNGVEIRRLYLRGFRPETTVTEWKSAVYIYPLRFAGRFLRQGRRVRPFFSVLSCLLNKIEMLFKYCPLHQRTKPSDK